MLTSSMLVKHGTTNLKSSPAVSVVAAFALPTGIGSSPWSLRTTHFPGGSVCSKAQGHASRAQFVDQPAPLPAGRHAISLRIHGRVLGHGVLAVTNADLSSVLVDHRLHRC